MLKWTIRNGQWVQVCRDVEIVDGRIVEVKAKKEAA